ncbi:hypothetical protein EDB89DRAFT_2231812 [Lactarius sanguifluus]|nr:hypothetical protein EDB89DRAFT_2231812 [Lactarius sanguifluus]
MFPSAKLGLRALLRGIRSIGFALKSKLKSFILLCLLFRPHAPRNLWRILSLLPRTVPKDVPEKTGGQARPSFPRAPGCIGYSAIHASRDFNRGSEPPLPLEPGDAEVLQLSPMMEESQSVSHIPASSRAPSLHGSPRPSNRQLSAGGAHSIAESVHSATQLPTRRLNNPFTLTHSRATSTQSAGAPRPDRSRSPSPFSHPLPPLESPGDTQTPDLSPIPRGTSMRSHHSIDIGISPPSRSQTIEPHYPMNPRGFSLASLPEALFPSSDQAPYRPSLSQQPVGTSPLADTPRNRSGGRVHSIRLMHSEQVSRYVNKNKGVVSLENSEYRLRPVEVDLPQYSRAVCPDGWVPALHPGGALYFHNPERGIFTDVYMYDPDLSAKIHEFAAILDSERIRLYPDGLPINHCDLVLDILKMENDETIWAYYYVDHNTRTLFWLHNYECGDDLLREVHGVREPSHVKLRLESLYWVHWSHYPQPGDLYGPRTFPYDASDELLGALLSSGIDSLTSKVSTSPYTVAEIESMRDFIEAAKGKSSLGPGNPHVITSIARLLSSYAYWRFLHFHGQEASHHDRYKSIYNSKGSRPKRTMLVRILSPILFFFPEVHLLELEKAWRDKTNKVIVEAHWKEFMQKLVSQWTEFVLYSTVMLAANVAFLAIPGVIVIPPDTRIRPSSVQTASSISLVFSIGSIITGLLLIRHNHMMMTKNPKNAWHYLHGMKWPAVGFEPLAIVFSLTYALLMWSVWGFFVALLLFTFHDPSGNNILIVGTAAGIVTTLIVWCIEYTWDREGREEEPIEWPYEPGPQVRTGLRQDNLEQA